MSTDGQDFIQYIIQAGDNLWTVADQYGSSVENLMAFNPGVDPYNPQVGQGIWIDSPQLEQRGFRRDGRGDGRGFRPPFYPPYFRPFFPFPAPYPFYPYPYPYRPYPYPYYPY